MAAERLSMRKIKEVLRLKALGQSDGQISSSSTITAIVIATFGTIARQRKPSPIEAVMCFAWGPSSRRLSRRIMRE